MLNGKRKAFTLIELISVLVIMAILALIVTPLVMNIIRSARVSADKRSIDAYGRSIELAIASYLLDNGRFPTSMSDIDIQYSGNKVECSTMYLNKDSSIYLTGCRVNGRLINGYAYGNEDSVEYKSYEPGEMVIYNKALYYVLENSDSSNNTVKLLKAEPLKHNEIYSLHIDDLDLRDTNGLYGKTIFGTTSNYSTSVVKKVIDSWKDSILKNGDSAVARLATVDEISNLGYEWFDNGSISGWKKTEATPEWLYDSSGAGYWTGSQVDDSTAIWQVYGFDIGRTGTLDYKSIRPVLEIHKSNNIENTYTEYEVGDRVLYNDVIYYVIEDSDLVNNTVKLLKEKPLLKSEIDALNLNDISAEYHNNYGYISYGDTSDYSTSNIKKIVDAWATTSVKLGDNAVARLITYDDLTDNLGFEKSNASTIIESSNGVTPSWVYSGEYEYWTMSQYDDSSSVWYLYDEYGRLRRVVPTAKKGVRPVLELNKSADIAKID